MLWNQVDALQKHFKNTSKRIMSICASGWGFTVLQMNASERTIMYDMSCDRLGKSQVNTRSKIRWTCSNTWLWPNWKWWQKRGKLYQVIVCLFEMSGHWRLSKAYQSQKLPTWLFVHQLPNFQVFLPERNHVGQARSPSLHCIHILFYICLLHN